MHHCGAGQVKASSLHSGGEFSMGSGGGGVSRCCMTYSLFPRQELYTTEEAYLKKLKMLDQVRMFIVK